ncbi:MAG: sialidase family protein [Candidatus Limivicinus sp.]|jgi:predicted neuraminidase
MLKLIRKEPVVLNHSAFRYCHASTVEIWEGRPTVCWFGGSFEAAPDSSIWCSRRGNSGWDGAVRLFGGSGVPLWNPVLYNDGSALHLYFKSGAVIAQWDSWQTQSLHGLEFSPAAEFAPKRNAFDVRGSARNKPVLTSGGRLLMPGSAEGEFNRAFIDLSEDGGKTWHKGPELAPETLDDSQIGVKNEDILVTAQSFVGRGVIQPSLWESSPGHIHALMRSSEAFIFRSDSEDDGRSWCIPYKTSLPNNNSGIDLAVLPDGSLVLACNPVGKNWGDRTPLVLDLSSDNGETWKRIFTLEDGRGEYSYPALICREDKLYLCYTANRKAIMYCEFAIE